MIVARIYDAITAHAERLCLADWRRNAVSSLGGAVIEIGSGTGLNLQHYGKKVERLVLAEPDRHMRAQLQRRIDATREGLLVNTLTDETSRVNAVKNEASRVNGVMCNAVVEICDQPAEALPYPDATFDHVVSTLVLCSVADPERALREAYRLLRRGGKLTLIEHILADVGSARQRWQSRLDPVWSRFSGGCHLDRDPRAMLARLPFEPERIELAEMRGAPAFLRTVLRATYTKL